MGEEGLREIPVELVKPNPRQPRTSFDENALAELADSIRARGVLQPIVVRPRTAGGYELIAGERRWRAAREAGIELLPALVREADDRDSLLLALVENVGGATNAYYVYQDEVWGFGLLTRGRSPCL